jgi:radical SAM protein with 4Fe4S-binding SPASM domain
MCKRSKNKDYYYGNIYKNTIEEILTNAELKIFNNHNKLSFNDECAKCGYLYLCKTGCPFVKNNYNTNKSYTDFFNTLALDNRNYFVCDFINNDYFFLSNIKILV